MFDFSPLTKRRIDNFKKNKRGFICFMIFLSLFTASLFAEFIANDKPVLIIFENSCYFPAFKTYSEQFFGGEFPSEADYKDKYVQELINKNGKMFWPPIRFSYDTINYDLQSPAPSPPNMTNLLGTDDLGRDVLARLIYGFRLSCIFGFLLTLISSVLGVIIGAVQGYFGGKIDLFMQRFLEIWGSLPQLFILVILSSLIIPGFWSLLFILILFKWTALVNLVRAEFLRVRNFYFVKAAKTMGLKNYQIILKHILPNALVSTITFMPFIMCGSIVSLSALDFLGLGMPVGSASLGDLVRQGKDNIEAPWLGLSAFFLLAFMLTLLVFIGEAFRDAFDPHKKYGSKNDE